MCFNNARLLSARTLLTCLLGAGALVGSYLVSRSSYILFHSIVEVCTVSVGLAIFFLVWNSRQRLQNHYLLFVGIAFLFVSGIDLLHALEYKGMGVFPGNSSNPATQLWVAGRYVQSVSLLLALAFTYRRVRVGAALVGFSAVAALLACSLYVWHIFPDCFVEGTGLTPFKKISEYVIVAIFCLSFVGLMAHRSRFDRTSLQSLGIFIALTMVSELAFTTYVSVYGSSNLAGHLVRLVAYYFLYRGIVVTGIRRPFDLLFRDLAASRDALEKSNVALESQVADRTRDLRQELADRLRAQEAVRKSESRYREVFDNVSDALFVLEGDDGAPLVLRGLNAAAERLTGVTAASASGRPFQDVAPGLAKDAAPWIGHCQETGEPLQLDSEYARPGLGVRHLSTTLVPVHGTSVARRLIVAARDITERVEAERAMRESEKKFRTLAEQSLVGIAMIQEGRFVFANHRLGAIFGCTRDELYAKSPAELFVEEDLPRLRSSLAGGTGSGFDVHIMVRGRKKDGTTRQVEVHGTRIELGESLTWIGVLVDITEQVEREQQLVSLNRVYQVLSTVNSLIAHERDRRRLLQEVCRISVEDGGLLMAWVGFVRAGSPDVVPEAWAGREEGYLSTVTISSGESALGGGPSGLAMREHRHVIVEDVAGDPCMAPWTEEALKRGFRSCASFPLTRDGVPIGVFTTYSADPGLYTNTVVALLDELAVDVSYALENLERERQRAQAMELVRESNERFRELTDSIREAFWMTNPDKSRTFYVSRGYEQIWQKSREELLANPQVWLDAVHPDDRDRVARALSKQPSGEYDEEYRIIRADGTIRWLHDRAFPVKGSSGEVTRIAGIAEDITERRDAQERLRQIEGRRRELEQQLIQAQKLESLGTLASGIAHDFNNLLAIILGHAYILEQESGESERLLKSIRAIVKASTRGTALVSQLLTIARKNEVRLEPLSVNDLVREIARLLLETFPKTIELCTNLQDGLPPILADVTQMHQVLMNLCINARDAMPRGGTLTISTDVACPAVSLQEGNSSLPPMTLPNVRIRVRDTGVGMDEETQRRVYEPFFTTKGPGKGTGLGLSLVRSIVERHQGVVEMSSAVGKGTTFAVYLPVGKSSARSDRPTAPDEADASAGRETVLVIEDEEMLAEIIQDALEEKGYSVLTARDGEEGMALYQRHRREIHVVFTDYGLPKLDGGEVARRIRAIDAHAKVILMSGEIDPSRRQEMLAAGAAGFLKKPFLPSEVSRVVRSVIDERTGGGQGG